MDIFKDGVTASGYPNATFQAEISYIKAATATSPMVKITAKQGQTQAPTHAGFQKYGTLK
ncbi:hypothetical protein [Hafnia psychrotolerans]|uniref:Uncharacterized protein n=1 Tax=Hafnia psychrotolerans TaxID=1477018 RepID=A0ABQ1GDH2_9GAMM|nr:hypothetical protein [Hafnia psychrotolerans]GGA41709.1 hypothetical protein GCM10011328_15870 [Hafnia psychrotolerans]